jgi:cytochrome c-type biogenesis protein CcmH
MRLLRALLMLVLFCAPAFAVNPGEVLDDPSLEARARAISENLRCLVCQNQSIDDSDADLARDLRLIVRERLVAGDTDAQVYDYLVARYGEFVLLRPVIAPHTILLWTAGPVILVVGVVGLWLVARRQKKPEHEALSPDEEAALARLARKDDTAVQTPKNQAS